jgi:hypothetical protein
LSVDNVGGDVECDLVHIGPFRAEFVPQFQLGHISAIKRKRHLQKKQKKVIDFSTNNVTTKRNTKKKLRID